MSRVAAKIELTAEEREQLERNVKQQRIEKRVYLRSRIILMSAEGMECIEIADKLGVSEKTARKWRKRFSEERLRGMDDLERSGAPERFTEEQRKEIISLATTAPELMENWTLSNVTKLVRERFGCPVSIETIRQILKNAGPQETPAGVVLKKKEQPEG